MKLKRMAHNYKTWVRSVEIELRRCGWSDAEIYYNFFTKANEFFYKFFADQPINEAVLFFTKGNLEGFYRRNGRESS